MNRLSRILKNSSIVLLAGTMGASIVPAKMAQSADVNVKGPTVSCPQVKTKASAPDVGVSVPNVSRLVPNVGKILRKGVGVPAPDTNAPDVSAPKVSASAPNKSCAKVPSKGTSK
ncbi:hypothetical protein [Altericista sp. CCNU0014]|uniref:hypothetical protein n=1 Tax=Altericista sp. CCNU0014 TaxID=3082949 RepID=UPI00384A6491